MAETGWTKGEWQVGSHPARPDTNIVRPVLFGSRVTVLPNTEGGHVSLNNPADAHLIAAAPALYEALADLQAAFPPVLRTHPIGAPGSPARLEQETQIAALDKARAALTAARGEK